MKNLPLPVIPTMHGCAAQARPDPQLITIFKSWTRFSFDDYGRCLGKEMQGLFCADTLLISKHRLRVNGEEIAHRLSAQTSSSTWAMRGMLLKSGEDGNLAEGVLPYGCLEISVRRQIDGGLSEFIRIFNHSSAHPRKVDLSLELSCPIIDNEFKAETKRDGNESFPSRKPVVKKRQRGIELRFEHVFGKRARTPSPELARRYRGHPPRPGATIVRGIYVSAKITSSSPGVEVSFSKKGGLFLKIKGGLLSRRALVVEIFYDLKIDEHLLRAPRKLTSLSLPMEKSQVPLDAPEFYSSNSSLNLITGQALTDLQDMRLARIGKKLSDSDLLSAGIPRYIGIFARDNLITGWQSAAFVPHLLGAVIERIGELQGGAYVPWRDEEPGRLPHEFRLNPKSLIGEENREAYYGDVTSTPFFSIALAKHYRWHGDLAFVRKQKKILQNCSDWLIEKIHDGDGLIYYEPAISEKAGGNRNQAWKDSGDAIVDEKGRICVPPLALVEVQGYAYKSLLSAADFFTLFKDPMRAEAALQSAAVLKKKFNQAFWNQRKRKFALAVRRTDETQVASSASNIGHCLGSGIIEPRYVPGIVRFLMAKDMFSGWGVRTLSALNPAYDPFSYHRGSVWPVENGEIAARLYETGHHQEAERIITAQFSFATLMPHFRLPEVFTGHERSDSSLLPGLYPQANLLQAWSSSATLQMVETFLGFSPNAPRRVLVIDPRLPEWLSELSIKNLHFAGGRVSLDFTRNSRGKTTFKVMKKTAGLKIRHG